MKGEFILVMILAIPIFAFPAWLGQLWASDIYPALRESGKRKTVRRKEAITDSAQNI